MSDSEEFLDEVQRKFLRKYWKMAIVLAAFFSAAVAGLILVFLWFVATAQATGFIPATIGLWSIGSLINFILHTIFWELVLVVSWVIVVVVVLYLKWYKTLPPEDTEGWPRGRGRREEGDAFGFFVGIIWLIIVYLDGRWETAFQAWTVNDWVYSMGAALLWMFLIIGIPVGLYFLWWINKERQKES
ncbi:MAG: hypothetical protein ACW99V_02390 [Candidatus Thorarchaeota archaeon]